MVRAEPRNNCTAGVDTNHSICSKNKQFALKLTFLVSSELGPKPLENLFNIVDSFITASYVTSIRLERYILFGPDGIFYIYFNSLKL